MSIKAVRAVLAGSKAKGTDKVILMCLAEHANDYGGSCYPSIATIARECSTGERNVQRRLKKLCELGELTIKECVGGRAKTNQYQINMDALKGGVEARVSGEERVACRPLKGGVEGQERVAYRAVNPGVGTTRTFEPSENRKEPGEEDDISHLFSKDW